MNAAEFLAFFDATFLDPRAKLEVLRAKLVELAAAEAPAPPEDDEDDE